MIVNNFKIIEINLSYYIGINRIKMSSRRYKVDQLFELIEIIQNKYKDSILQFFDDKYVLNTEHIYNACYFVMKAFLQDKNISNKKELEFLLYLATKRQIKSAIVDFGIDNEKIRGDILNICIVSSEENLNLINNDVKKTLNASEEEITLNRITIEKYEMVKNYFKITDNQITTVLKSYGINKNEDSVTNEKIDSLYMALNDLISEKMALLSLEKVTSD